MSSNIGDYKAQHSPVSPALYSDNFSLLVSSSDIELKANKLRDKVEKLRSVPAVSITPACIGIPRGTEDGRAGMSPQDY